MIRHGRKARRTQVDRVKCTQLLDAILGHHVAGLQVRLTGPVKLLPLEIDAVVAACRFEDTQAFWYDFFADAVTGDHGYFYSCTHSFLILTKRALERALDTQVSRDDRFKAKPVVDIVAYCGGDVIMGRFFTGLAQNYYVLLSGRWYRGDGLSGDLEWYNVPNDELPESSGDVPENSVNAATLSQVAGALMSGQLHM